MAVLVVEFQVRGYKVVQGEHWSDLKESFDIFLYVAQKVKSLFLKVKNSWFFMSCHYCISKDANVSFLTYSFLPNYLP